METGRLAGRHHPGRTDGVNWKKRRSVRHAVISLLGLTALALGVGTAHAADFGLSITVGQPGFYGLVNVGGYPPPEVIYGHPVIAEPDDGGYYRRPVYLHVPPGWARHWRWHCAEFRACHRPVYFVRDSWYDDIYVPRYRREHEQDWRGDYGDDGHWERGGDRVRSEHERRDHWRHRGQDGPGQEWSDRDH